MGEDFEARANGAAFGVVGAINEARYASLDDGACAHAARLDGDVEGGISEAVVAEKAGGFAKSNHFRMGGGVIVANGAVARSSENLAVVNERRSDRNFAGCGRGACFSQGFLHELDVIFHCRRENNTLKQGEKKESRRCLTIGEGANKLGACANSWGDCFKSIF